MTCILGMAKRWIPVEGERGVAMSFVYTCNGNYLKGVLKRIDIRGELKSNEEMIATR